MNRISKPKKMKISIFNKILLSIQIIPIVFLLLLSLFLLGDSRPVFFTTLMFSILSMISLIYIMVKTIMQNGKIIKDRFVYLSHIGLIITIMGVLVLLINGNGFKELSPNAPFSAFSTGLVVCISYFHVMIINRFFISKKRTV